MRRASDTLNRRHASTSWCMAASMPSSASMDWNQVPSSAMRFFA